jgi:hypothetical protein
MIVDSVSPTPFALLRRAKNFEYRDDDEALQRFSAYEDPVRALTDECRRVLECIASTNQSAAATEAGNQDASWSRFEDFGFSGLLDSSSSVTSNGTSIAKSPREFSSFASGARSRNNDFGRPTTPSWADFLSSGFADENGEKSPPALLLPPDKILPPIGEASRVHSSQSHMRHGLQTGDDLEPGELASITRFDLDDTFWWVWMTSLAAEEPTGRKAVFGRCTLLETRISGAKWLVMEEQVKGASPGPEEGAYIAEKKGRFSFRTRLGRRKSTGKKPPLPKEPYNRTTTNTPMSKTSIGPDQHARIQAAAARLAQKEKDQEAAAQASQRRARMDDAASTKTNSVLTLQPHLLTDAAPAMKWDKKFGEGAKDRDVLRAQYLGNVNAGRGSRDDLLTTANGKSSAQSQNLSNRDLPALPNSEVDASASMRDATPSPAARGPAPAVASPDTEASSSTRMPAAKLPIDPTVLDEKPVSEDQLNTHPALRKPVAERKPVAPTKKDTPAEERPTMSPEPVKKSPPKKLKKNTGGGGGGGGGGFRKLFGKKKAEAPAPADTNVDDFLAGPEAPQNDSGRYTPQPERSASIPNEPLRTQSIEKSQPVRAQSPEQEPSPTVSAVSQDYRKPSIPDAPTPDLHEQREANQAFARFDQGPMDDMPAFVPDDSSGEVTPNVSEFHKQHDPDQADEYSRDIVTPTARAPGARADDESELSVDYGLETSPSQDRWAQIRRNAAERAARLSEEQTRRSRSQSARTDEGETSGEETIESRVARIKARVAELTGNVDGQPAGGR